MADFDDEKYQAHRDYLLETEKHNIVILDKALLTLSSSALGGTIVFSDHLSSPNNTVYPALLLLAWLFFGLALCLNLISYATGAQEASQRLNSLDEDREKYYDEMDYSSKTISFNYWALASFLLGAILLASFTFLNLVTANDSEHTETTNVSNTGHETTWIADQRQSNKRASKSPGTSTTKEITPQFEQSVLT